jgi:hypothetical protein
VFVSGGWCSGGRSPYGTPRQVDRRRCVIERARCRPTTPHHDPSGPRRLPAVCEPSATSSTTPNSLTGPGSARRTAGSPGSRPQRRSRAQCRCPRVRKPSSAALAWPGSWRHDPLSCSRRPHSSRNLTPRTAQRPGADPGMAVGDRRMYLGPDDARWPSPADPDRGVVESLLIPSEAGLVTYWVIRDHARAADGPRTAPFLARPAAHRAQFRRAPNDALFGEPGKPLDTQQFTGRDVGDAEVRGDHRGPSNTIRYLHQLRKPGLPSSFRYARFQPATRTRYIPACGGAVPRPAPQAARASTNPASTSVSRASRSSVVTGARATRRSRTAARLDPCLLAFTEPARRTKATIELRESRASFRCQKQHRSRENPQVLGLWRLMRARGTLGFFLNRLRTPPRLCDPPD